MGGRRAVWRGALLAALLLWTGGSAAGQDVPVPQPDTVALRGADTAARRLPPLPLPRPHEAADSEADRREREQRERNDRLYDSIRTKSGRHAVSRALYRAFFRSQRDTTVRMTPVDEWRTYAPYAGRRIASIRIERLQPFDPEGPWIGRTANRMHSMTHSRMIRRDLLFAQGDTIDPQRIARTLELLQSRRYLSHVAVEVRPDTLDSTQVDLIVRTRDSWTIDVDASLHGSGEASVGLSEANLFGLGHRLRLETNIDYHDFGYGGNVVEYDASNIFGTFFDFDFAAGRSFRTSRFELGLRKEFLLPTDYELGAAYHNDKVKHYFVDRDTTELVKARDFDLWGGYAHQLPRLRSSLFLTGRYNRRNVTLRPADTGPRQHPALHDYDLLLFGTGLYREHTYSANMIYGYGRREYIQSGFKSEAVGGWLWSEFADELYLGLSHRMGDFTRIGYLMGRVAWGAYFEPRQGDWRRSTLDLETMWFSNLLRTGRSHVRQFVTLRYTRGWNRFGGADESIRFGDEARLRALRPRYAGTNRLLLNTETVLFTPYQPLGFKIACFGFWDAGLLGYHGNLFRNAAFTSVGIGLRMRNERLVFRAIQIQLGLSFGRRGLADTRYFRFSSESVLDQCRYRPGRPDRIVFE